MISVADMQKPSHKRTITPADIEAAKRLKAIWLAIPRQERPTQQQLADAWDGPGEANQSLISQYMNGGIALNYRATLFFARQLGCADTDIRSDLPEQRAATASADDGDWSDILGYAQAMGLGGGPEAQEYAETHKLKFRADSLARKRLNPSKLAVMYGRGDSMEPRVLSGDAILFDMSDTRPRDGALFVIMIDGGGAAKEYQVKRCEILDDFVYFKADNPGGDHNWKKPRRMDSPRHPIEIIGRVRWIGSWEG